MVGGAPDPAPARPATVHGWDEFRGADDALRSRTLIDVDMAAILYTSGSTGQAEGGRALPPQPARRRRRASASTSATTRTTCILAALPLSFDAGLQPAHDRRSRSAPTSCSSTTCCPRDVVRLCAKHRVTGLTCVPPLWIQLAEQDWPAEATREPALLRQHRRADAEGDARPAARDLPAGQAVPDVRAHRGVPLDLPRPGRGRPPARLDRQGDPERRDPRRPRRTARAATPARRASSSTAARWSRWATGTTRSGPPSGSGPRPGRDGAHLHAPRLAVWSGDLVVRRRGGLPLLRRPQATR